MKAAVCGLAAGAHPEHQVDAKGIRWGLHSVNSVGQTLWALCPFDAELNRAMLDGFERHEREAGR